MVTLADHAPVADIDYVLVRGATELQAAALKSRTNRVVYVPDANANGIDSFTYTATDCPGDLFRTSDAATVTMNISAVNDQPVTTSFTAAVPVDKETNVTLLVSDADIVAGGTESLLVSLVSLPTSATLRTSDGSLATVGLLPSATLYVNSSRCGDDTFLYSASDGILTSHTERVTLHVECPPACTTADMVFDVSACSGSKTLRTITWAYNASTSCDLVRASALPSTSSVECDEIDPGSIAACVYWGLLSVCVATKLFFLGWLGRNVRHASVANAQPLFLALSVVGAVVADVTPSLLVGDVSDGKCHGFASMLLFATTLTFGPIILKSVRVWFIFDNPSMKRRQRGCCPARTRRRALCAWPLGVRALAG